MNEEMYKVYYETDHPILINREFTKEQLEIFLNSLTYAEKAHLRVTKIKGSKGEKEIER